MTGVYVAAGSNVCAEQNIRSALGQLALSFPHLAVSPAYRNAAVGFAGNDFVNLVVGFDTDMPLRAVIDELHRIEKFCGRERNAPKWAPRSMDLDILLYGDLVLSEPGLTLPRLDLTRRPYMLGPLADLAPQIIHPTLKRSIGELWREFDRDAHRMTAITLNDSNAAAAVNDDDLTGDVRGVLRQE
jgi:2-amino-4-hydroxy-6-hydroxymethyldihydropteridine diphosphokinase